MDDRFNSINFKDIQLLKTVEQELIEDAEKHLLLRSSATDEYLRQDMADILVLVATYLKELEASAKTRRSKRISHVTGDYTEFCSEEKRFLRRLEYGKGIMNSVIESLNVVPTDSSGKLSLPELNNRINIFVEGIGNTTSKNIEEMNFCLKELLVRFARICETEGFRHDLPFQGFPDGLRIKESLTVCGLEAEEKTSDEVVEERNGKMSRKFDVIVPFFNK